MFHPKFLAPALLVISFAGSVTRVHATISTQGDVAPGGTWTSSTWGDVGYMHYALPSVGGNWPGHGTVTVTGGSRLLSGACDVGLCSGCTGVVTVDGNGSTWNASGRVAIGSSGSGTLNISNGGSVSAADAMILASNGGSGVINFGPGGGTLTTWHLTATPSQLTGVGTINTNGLASDVNLVFDSGATTTTTLNQSGKNIVINLDMSDPNKVGSIDAGCYGNGSLMIRNGATLYSDGGFAGANVGSTGVATVDGPGSKWINSGSLHVGSSGKGTLSITNGATVRDTTGCVGCYFGATGMAKVEGRNSTWTNSSSLQIGASGSATVSVLGGAAVTASSVSIGTSSNHQPLLAIDVGRNSSLSVGGGTITNCGTIRILAGPGADSSTTYTPISAGKWVDSGTYQAIGGTWSTASHQFTASLVQTGNAGALLSVNLAQRQRVLVTDSVAHQSLGASFMSSSNTLSFTASAVSAGNLSALQGLNPGESVVGDWGFSVNSGYTSGTPVYLSFGIGANQSTDRLELWQLTGTGWTPYAANDLTYDGNYASFTVTDLNGYAVVAVPEPATFVMLVFGAVGLLGYAWRRQRV